MTISAPFISTGRLASATVVHRSLRAVARRPALLVLMALYVFAASCAESAPGLLAGIAVVAVFCVRTVCIVRAELRATG